MTDISPEDNWVTVTDGADIVGYHRKSLVNAISRMAKKAEEEREIRLRRVSWGWMLWLPDLIAYAQKARTKPQRKRKQGA